MLHYGIIHIEVPGMHTHSLAQQLQIRYSQTDPHSDLALLASNGHDPSPGFSSGEALLALMGCHEEGTPTPGPSNASPRSHLQHLPHPMCPPIPTCSSEN